MLNEKKLLTKMLTKFRGCDSALREDLGTATSVTPTKDGWLVAAGTSTVSSGVAPVIRIGTEGGTIFAEGVGVISNGAMLITSCPVKAGVTYKITLYRCNISSTILYY